MPIVFRVFMAGNSSTESWTLAPYSLPGDTRPLAFVDAVFRVLVFWVMQSLRFVIVLTTVSLFGCMTGKDASNGMAATHDLPAGTVVQSTDVVIVEISRTQISPDIPRRRSDVVGHRTRHPIPQGKLILLSELQP